MSIATAFESIAEPSSQITSTIRPIAVTYNRPGYNKRNKEEFNYMFIVQYIDVDIKLDPFDFENTCVLYLLYQDST